MKRIRQGGLCLVMSLFIGILSFAQDTTEVVTTWLKENSIPIKHLDAGSKFSDLKPLKKILKDVTVIGLGEATHGTREFFQMKHRLVKFLVTEMNFTSFILECSYAGCQPINEYILTGEGDRNALLTSQGYMVYDTEEFLAMLDWMKAYNQRVPDKKKIKFYGMDIGMNAIGREKVLDFIRKYVPEKVSVTDSIFRILASEEERFPSRLNESTLKRAFIPVHALTSFFTTNKEWLVSASSPNEWEKVYKYSQVMEQFLLANIKDTTFSLSPPMLTRSQYMGQNVLYFLDKEPVGTKFMVWAHNGHIAHPGLTNVGGRLKERLGDKYFALGFQCNEGIFLSRVQLPDSTWGDLVKDTIRPLEKDLSWYFSRSNKGNAFIVLRSTASNPIIEKWLETPRKMNVGFWLYRGSAKNFATRSLKNYWDGVLFIERTTASHPTRNALVRSANRIGF